MAAEGLSGVRGELLRALCVRAAPVCRGDRYERLWVRSGGRLRPQLCACEVVSGGGARAPDPPGARGGRRDGSAASCGFTATPPFRRKDGEDVRLPHSARVAVSRVRVAPRDVD